MKNKMLAFVAFLQGQSAFTSVFGEAADCRLYPFIGPEIVQAPFAIYSMGSEPLSGNSRRYSGLISLYFDDNNATELIEMTDAVVQLLDAAPGYEAGEVETGYSERYATNVANINFNIY